MIKTGILGAHTPTAGELIRILINHPDVMLTTVASDQAAGDRVDAIHRGLIGDTNLTLLPTLRAEGHNAIFLCGEPWQAQQWLEQNLTEIEASAQTADPIRIIDLTGAFRNGGHDMVYGLPEHNRKALVRGATRASIPSPVAMAVGLALFPLAKNMLLQGPVTVAATIADTFSTDFVPKSTQPDVESSTRLDPIAPIEHRPDAEAIAAEISALLGQIQPGFNHPVDLTLSIDHAITRGITATVNTPSTLSEAELRRHYTEAYQDHNFTYLISRIPLTIDVANTNKCLIHLCYSKSIIEANTLRITSVIDNMLKGSAGNAVHCLNLLFGLSERTGLSLKASAFGHLTPTEF